MKRLFFLIFIFATTVVHATPEEAFLQANTYYANGEYAQAAELYEGLTDEFSNMELHYNLGNAYYKLNEIAKSILHYEKALKLDPYNKDILYNLELARERTLDKIDGKQIESDVLNKLIAAVPVNFWAFLTIGLMIIGVLLFWLISKTHRIFIKNILLYTSIFIVLVSFVSLFLTLKHKDYLDTPQAAIIFTQKVDVLTEPTEEGRNTFMLHEGTKVKILKEDGEWTRITIGNDKEGWIRTRDCAYI